MLFFGPILDSRKFFAILTFILISLIPSTSQEPNRLRDTKEILNKLLESYGTKLIRPNGRNRPDDLVAVNVNINNLDFKSISDYDMEFGVTMSFTQEWFDHRLKYEDPGNLTFITLTTTSNIWTPDLVFTNEKDSQQHSLMYPNKYIWIYPSGKVLYNARISLTLACDMQLEMFPFDAHICNFGIASYAYTTRDTELIWKEDLYKKTKQDSVTGFKITKVNFAQCHEEIKGEKFSSLRLSVSFHREVKYYLYHTYLPSSILVAVTWGAFLLDRHALLMRSIIVLCALFGLGSIAAETEASVPHVNYIKAMDIWIAVCFIFMLTVLLEFIIVGRKGLEEKASNIEDSGDVVTAVIGKMSIEPTGKRVIKETACYASILQRIKRMCPKDPECIDKQACLIFPALFLVFLSVYFLAIYVLI